MINIRETRPNFDFVNYPSVKCVTCTKKIYIGKP